MYKVGGVFLKFLASWVAFLVAATYSFHEYMLHQNGGMGRRPTTLTGDTLHPAAVKALSMLEGEKSIMLV